MTAPYTPSGVFPDLDGSAGQGPLQLQSDGEVLSYDLTFRSSSGNRGAIAKLIDGLAALRSWLAPRGDIVRAQPAVAFNAATSAPLAPIGGLNLDTGVDAVQFLDVPHGVTIKAATAYINPGNDGTLPGTRPTVILRSLDLTTGVDADESTLITDPNNTVGPYEAHHGFGPTGLSVVVDRTKKTYFLTITGETGANAAKIEYTGATVTYAYPS
jgi:hypothetical protein